MPTKRTRTARAPRMAVLTPEELQWLTGDPQAGANAFWQHSRDAEKLARCLALLETHAHLIPPGRLPTLHEDLRLWGAQPGVTQ